MDRFTVQVWTPFFAWALSPLGSWLHTRYKYHTIVLVGLSCHVGHCGSWVWQMNRFCMFLVSLADCVSCIISLGGRTQGEGFHVSSKMITLRPLSTVCATFRKRIFSSNSGKQPRTRSVTYSFLGVSRYPLTNKSNGGLLAINRKSTIT